MGKLIQFPCNDYYEEYEDYYEDEVNGMNKDYEVQIKENWFKGFIRKVLMFILVRL